MTERNTPDGNWIPSVRALRSKYYPTYSPDLFETLVLQNVHPSDQVLEVGAGTGRDHQNYFELRGKVSRYVGVDPDPGVLTNPFLDQAFQASAGSLPFANETFDLVFHNYVAEHFEFPVVCNREISRVLKPRGLLMFQTPSRYYYACAMASVTPHWFHQFYIQRFGSGRTEKEVFPVFYRLNDAKSIETQLHACGFQTEIRHHSIPPGYLRFNKFAFLAGILYERTLERSFPGLRGTIIVTARKEAGREKQVRCRRLAP